LGSGGLGIVLGEGGGDEGGDDAPSCESASNFDPTPIKV
jgi:hypothetical protein